MPNKPLEWGYEKDCGNIVCGVDEAGRGPIAGRVYAAAVILPEDVSENGCFAGLQDSKKLSAKKREELEEIIKKNAVTYSVAFCEVSEIEQMNILEATLLAMRRAIDGLKIKPDFALIDGNISRGFAVNAKAVVGGDGKVPSIAAASILAKTARDRYCIEVMDKEYPQYMFAKHKGYGTKAHYNAIKEYGPCPYHRQSFLKKFLEK